MASKTTNRLLRGLLLSLGFKKQAVVDNNYRVFRHAESDCVAILPDNRDDHPARQADIAGLRDYLHQTGHLSEEEFDTYLRDGILPAA
ncbi:MAG: hypothetical protein GXX96_23075 [Planctomycetaceae bacterium]|nr:hypothetical protein [Planctomycetaceae bacterium]